MGEATGNDFEEPRTLRLGLDGIVVVLIPPLEAGQVNASHVPQFVRAGSHGGSCRD